MKYLFFLLVVAGCATPRYETDEETGERYYHTNKRFYTGNMGATCKGGGTGGTIPRQIRDTVLTSDGYQITIAHPQEDVYLCYSCKRKTEKKPTHAILNIKN